MELTEYAEKWVHNRSVETNLVVTEITNMKGREKTENPIFLG
jgi:hypothetical protein